MKRIFSKIKWKKVIKWVIILAVIVTAGIFAYQKFFVSKINQNSAEDSVTTAKVETRDIQNVLSASSTIEPLNTYEITTLVEGEVIAADFEEGDTVQEGQVLYQIATDTLDSKIETAQTAIDRAQKSYDKAVSSYDDAVADLAEVKADYREAQSEYGDVNVKATETGVVKTLYVKAGDTVQKGTQIAEVYDNSSMLLVIPFAASDVSKSLIGKTAEITIESSDEVLQGVVIKVSSIDETLTGSRLVNQVTIQVKNPGGITTQTTATASIGDLYSSDLGTFGVLTSAVMTAEESGEIGVLKIEEGSTIKEGDIIYSISDEYVNDQLEPYATKVESAEDALDNAQESVDNAQDSIEDAETSMQDIIDTRTDYSITAPITGKVISKNSLAGDTINNQTTLCTIYDLSAVTFEMSVDELDVMSVEVGQEVDVTADAFDNVTFSGIITNVSIQSTASQGVTQYPVTVKITDVGDLLPGMNVTGEIIIEKVEGVLAIPSDALMRGDVVYVKDDTVLEAVGDVPAGFKEVEVVTGITDGDYVEVISGLTGDEELYVVRISEAVTTMNGMTGFGSGGMTGERPSDASGMPSGGGGGMPGQ